MGIPSFARQLTCFAAGAVRRGDLCGGEKRRAGGGTRSVLRPHARRSCLSGVRAAHKASSAALPRHEHRSGVAAQRRPPQCEPRRTAPAAKQAPEQRKAQRTPSQHAMRTYSVYSTRPIVSGLKPRSAALPLRARAPRALLRERISRVSSRALPPRPVPAMRTLRV